jgi:Flp pilus assembly protein TadB
MMFLIFLGALSLAVLTFEVLAVLQASLSSYGRSHTADRLSGAATLGHPRMARRSTWDALLLAFIPRRFDLLSDGRTLDVVALLRRAGDPYDTPGDFYAAAVQVFAAALLLGGLLAGALVALGRPLAAPFAALGLIILGLRWPYARLKRQARRRAEALRSNLLLGLSVLESLLSSGVQVQEALRRTSGIGGPFNNLLGLLVARMKVEGFEQALEIARSHLPDPSDMEAQLFLQDLEDFFIRGRPILESVLALRGASHRGMVEATEARASLVRQRSSLYGILAVLGLLFFLVGPFLSSF